MGEKVYGYHAIEEAIKKAGMGSTLFVERGGGEKLEALVRSAKLTGRIAVKKLSREELQYRRTETRSFQTEGDIGI